MTSRSKNEDLVPRLRRRCSRRAALRGVGLSLLSWTSAVGLAACVDDRRPVTPTDAGMASMESDAGPPGCAETDICVDTSDPANAAIATVDGAGILRAPADRIMIVRTAVEGADAFAVVSAICPHAFCDVDYDASAHNLPCYCHGSLFALDGTLLRGPSPIGLRRYAWDFDGTTLTIHT